MLQSVLQFHPLPQKVNIIKWQVKFNPVA